MKDVSLQNISMSYDEFCKFRDDNSELKIEFIDDCVRVVAGVSPAHSLICKRIVTTLDDILCDKSCEAHLDSTAIRFKKDGSVHYTDDAKCRDLKVYRPDVSVLCDNDYMGIEYVGKPKLIVEVLSRATKDIDFGEKLQTYSKNKIQNYWIVDPRRKIVYVHTQPSVDVDNQREGFIYLSVNKVSFGGVIEYGGSTLDTSDFFSNIDDSLYVW